MSDVKPGQLVYSATWGAGPTAGSCIRASRHLCLAEFMKTKARKCKLSAWECASVNGDVIVIKLGRTGHPALTYGAAFTRKEADEALFTQRFAADGVVMLNEAAPAA